MNYNIALSSFVYILIFIFPGVLFRKFYYIGPFTKQFNQGNLFERFIITLFLSVLSLTCSVGILLLLRDVFHIAFLPSISYKTIYDVFCSLQDNKLPEPGVFTKIYKDFLILMLLIFSLSGILGSLSYLFITTFKFDMIFNVFKFNDKWHYHAKGKNSDLSGKKYMYTEVNILTQDNENKKIMYSGSLSDYNVDDTNNLTAVFIEKAHRYTYDNMENKEESRERTIRGMMMWIPCTNVLNVNFTHITEERVKKSMREKVLITLKIIFALLYPSTFILFWIDSFLWHFEHYTLRAIFIIFSILAEVLIYNLIKDLINGKNGNLNLYFHWIIICLGPVIGTMNIISFKIIIVIELIISALFIYFLPKLPEK